IPDRQLSGAAGGRRGAGHFAAGGGLRRLLLGLSVGDHGGVHWRPDHDQRHIALRPLSVYPMAGHPLVGQGALGTAQNDLIAVACNLTGAGSAMTDEPATAGQAAGPVIDPRCGDIEDDASSPKRRSLLSLAGSLLLEISLPKLILAWILLLVVPGLLLGL